MNISLVFVFVMVLWVDTESVFHVLSHKNLSRLSGESVNSLWGHISFTLSDRKRPKAARAQTHRWTCDTTDGPHCIRCALDHINLIFPLQRMEGEVSHTHTRTHTHFQSMSLIYVFWKCKMSSQQLRIKTLTVSQLSFVFHFHSMINESIVTRPAGCSSHSESQTPPRDDTARHPITFICPRSSIT